MLSSDTIFNLQLWVIIIISCRLFLCHDEFHDLSDGDFVSSLFAVFPEGIEHLGLWVNGKADKGVKKYLKVVADQEYPDLDAVSGCTCGSLGGRVATCFHHQGRFTHDLIMAFTAQPFAMQQQ